MPLRCGVTYGCNSKKKMGRQSHANAGAGESGVKTIENYRKENKLSKLTQSMHKGLIKAIVEEQRR